MATTFIEVLPMFRFAAAKRFASTQRWSPTSLRNDS
jgi:hypothetical protein